jgi:hypothetical protein
MSVAAQEACLLRELLAARSPTGDPLQGLAKVFFEKIPTLIETPWNVATFDFIHPATRGQRPADFESRLKFAAAFTKLAAEDPAVHRLTAEVQHLVKTPQRLPGSRPRSTRSSAARPRLMATCCWRTKVRRFTMPAHLSWSYRWRP